MELKFPLAVLRLALQAYCLARRLIYREVVGQATFTTSAILVGGGFATDMLALLLHKTLTRLRYELPRVHLYVIVDDLTIRTEGRPREAASTLTRATRQCIQELEGELDMKVSRGKPWTTPPEDVKSLALATTKEARSLISTGMRSMGIPTRLATNNLGVDYAPGRRMRQKVTMINRWQKVKMKTKRCRRMGKDAAVHISRTALVPSMAYGVECTSMPSGALNDLRGAVAGLLGPLKGRSATARLAIRGCEPSYAIVLAPLKAWWKAWWRGSLPTPILESALLGAEAAAERAGHLEHSNISGGAGAYLSSLKRIGWQARGVAEVITENGSVMTLGGNCDPKMLLRMAGGALGRKLALDSGLSATLTSIDVADGFHRAASRASAFEPLGKLPGLEEQASTAWWSQYQHCEGRLIPWLQPAIDALRGAERRGVGEALRGSFIALVEGGWWPQARLHHHGLAADPFCRRCCAEHGTLWHRASKLCTAEEPAAPVSAIVEEGKSRWWDPLFSRGIPAVPLLPNFPCERVWCYPETAGSALITGEVFTDGAMKGRLPEVRRGGWAFAKLGANKEHIQAVFYGVSNDAWLTIVRAELKAVEEALRRAVAPLTIYTDNAAVVNAYCKGEKYACRDANDGADIWRRIWLILADFGECQILKVKAHTTAADAQAGVIDPVKQAGNATADFFAVQARKLAAAEALCQAFEKHYARARAWYKHILDSIGDWQQDTFADAEAVPAEDEASAEPPGIHQDEMAPSASTRKHSVWLLAGVVRCRTCGRTFGSAASPSAVARQRCRGPVSSRVLQSLGLRQGTEHAHAYTEADMVAGGKAGPSSGGGSSPPSDPQAPQRETAAARCSCHG